MAERVTLRYQLAPELSDQPELFSAAQAATDTLREFVAGESPGGGDRSVAADWATIQGATGERLLRLRLTDGPDQVEFAYRPSELTGRWGWFHLDRAYRALLRATSKRLVTAVMSHVGGGVE